MSGQRRHPDAKDMMKLIAVLTRSVPGALSRTVPPPPTFSVLDEDGLRDELLALITPASILEPGDRVHQLRENNEQTLNETYSTPHGWATALEGGSFGPLDSDVTIEVFTSGTRVLVRQTLRYTDGTELVSYVAQLNQKHVPHQIKASDLFTAVNDPNFHFPAPEHAVDRPHQGVGATSGPSKCSRQPPE